MVWVAGRAQCLRSHRRPPARLTPVQLTKHHGLANDFLVVLDEVNGRVPDGRRRAGPSPVRPAPGHRCRRPHPRRLPPAGSGVDVVMHLFNADGSRAEMSGNGIRCLGQAAGRGPRAARGRVRGVDRRRAPPAPGRARAPTSHTSLVSVDMGPVGPGPAVAPRRGRRTSASAAAATGDMGNPHLVVLVDDPRAVDLAGEGAWLERQLPRRASTSSSSPSTGDRHPRPAGVGAGRRHHRGLRHRRLRRRPVAHDWGLVGRAGPGRRCPAAPPRSSWARPITLIGPAVHDRHRRVGRCLSATSASRTPDPVGATPRTAAASASSAAPRAASSSAPSGSASCSSVSRCPRPRRRHRALARRAGAAGRHRRRRRGGPGRPAPHRARSRHLHRQGQGRGAARAGRGGRRRHRGLRRRAHPGPAVQPGEAARPHRHRPHRGDPRHLRPERPQPGGQGAGRAGPAALPAAPAAGQGRHPQPAGRRHRHPRSRRDPARGRPSAPRAPHPQARGRPARHRPPPRHPAQGPAPLAAAHGRHRRATPTPASPRCSTG